MRFQISRGAATQGRRGARAMAEEEKKEEEKKEGDGEEGGDEKEGAR